MSTPAYNLSTSATVVAGQPNSASPNNLQIIMKWVSTGVSVFGFISNFVVMAVVLKTKKLRQQPRNWFIFHQSLTDFISAAFFVANANKVVPNPLSVSLVIELILFVFFIRHWPAGLVYFYLFVLTIDTSTDLINMASIVLFILLNICY
jgi:hypothetical protein